MASYYQSKKMAFESLMKYVNDNNRPSWTYFIRQMLSAHGFDDVIMLKLLNKSYPFFEIVDDELHDKRMDAKKMVVA